MSSLPQLITESVYLQAQKELKKIKQENRISLRLRAIVSAKKYGMGTVSRVLYQFPSILTQTHRDLRPSTLIKNPLKYS